MMRTAIQVRPRAKRLAPRFKMLKRVVIMALALAAGILQLVVAELDSAVDDRMVWVPSPDNPHVRNLVNLSAVEYMHQLAKDAGRLKITTPLAAKEQIEKSSSEVRLRHSLSAEQLIHSGNLGAEAVQRLQLVIEQIKMSNQKYRSSHSSAVRPLALALVEHDDVVSGVCNSAGHALDSLCNLAISYPTGIDVIYDESCTNNCCSWDCGQEACLPYCCDWNCGQEACTDNWCEWDCGQCTNNCCTYDCGNIFGTCFGCEPQCGQLCLPCSGFSEANCGQSCINIPCTGCSASQCGEECANVPCTGCSLAECGQSCAGIPTGIAINYEDTTICEQFPGSESLVALATALCNCLSSLPDADVNSGALTQGAIEALSRVSVCITEAGFEVVSNRDQVISDTENSGGVVLFGPPINSEMYVYFTFAGIGCAVGASCDAVISKIVDYFRSLFSQISGGLLDSLRRVIISDFIERISGNVNEVLAVLGESGELPVGVEVCSSQAWITAYYNARTEASTSVDRLEVLVQETRTVTESITSALDKFRDLIDALSNSYREHVEEILSGKSVLLEDGVNFLKSGSDMVKLFEDVATVVEKVISYKQILEDSHRSYTNLANIASKIRQDCEGSDLQIIPIQIDHIDAAILKAYRDSLGQFDTQLSLDILEVGIATYNRWADIETEVPCVQSTTIDFSEIIDGLDFLETSAPFLEIHSCPYSGRIPFPNEHIPYLRVRIVSFEPAGGAELPYVPPPDISDIPEQVTNPPPSAAPSNDNSEESRMPTFSPVVTNLPPGQPSSSVGPSLLPSSNPDSPTAVPSNTISTPPTSGSPAGLPSISESSAAGASVSANPNPDTSVSTNPNPDTSVSANPNPDTSVSANPSPDATESPSSSLGPDPATVCVESWYLDMYRLERVHVKDLYSEVLCIEGSSLPCGTEDHLLEIGGRFVSYGDFCGLSPCSRKMALVNGIRHSQASKLVHDGELRLTTMTGRTPWIGLFFTNLLQRHGVLLRTLDVLQRREYALLFDVWTTHGL